MFSSRCVAFIILFGPSKRSWRTRALVHRSSNDATFITCSDPPTPQSLVPPCSDPPGPQPLTPPHSELMLRPPIGRQDGIKCTIRPLAASRYDILNKTYVLMVYHPYTHTHSHIHISRIIINGPSNCRLLFKLIKQQDR